jgi:hypothetical protein
VPFIIGLSLVACARRTAPIPPDASLAGDLESAWQDLRYWDDQHRLLESLGRDTTPGGLSGATVSESLRVTRARVAPLLERAGGARDGTALAAIRAAWNSGLSGEPEGAGVAPDTLHALSDSVFAAYGSAAGRIVVDGDTLNRLGVLGLLARTGDPARRERLFRALEPVWKSVNEDNRATSPYRRLVALRRARWSDTASPITRKGPAFGLTPQELERWLVGALERWRAAMPDTLLEPWDWYYFTGEASRRLSPRLPDVHDLLPINDAYYRQLGADPVRLGLRYDLEARPGKYPVAYCDFGSRPRWVSGRRVPGEPWIFTSYLTGGLDNLAELLHETGHGIHIAAIHTRPAFTDWPDNDTFTEALADLPAMELYEPAWQIGFLGDSAPLAASLRARYSGVIFDIAWALFEIRVHGEPEADPNAVWTAITRDYLRIRPHPEWSWWAMRGQLIDGPGYLINYALGAFIVADLREAIRKARGTAAWHDPSLYAWLSERLYRFGLERSSRRVLEDLLGRPLRSDALFADLARMGVAGGRADGRTGGRADGRTGGRADHMARDWR